jgi:8-oxo-dGTP pyrophosphatase MutT (NUDIX family)
LKNYDPKGNIGRRPSVRGIIIKDGKVAMMHSLRYDYYKLPGGGIEQGESLEETLVREVQEESGLAVKKDSIREFGYVKRIEKGKVDDIFVQENFYFLCEAEEEPGQRNLDDYEAFEEFTLEYVTASYAIEINQQEDHGEKADSQTFAGMILRENKVLELLQQEGYC